MYDSEKEGGGPERGGGGGWRGRYDPLNVKQGWGVHVCVECVYVYICVVCWLVGSSHGHWYP